MQAGCYTAFSMQSESGIADDKLKPCAGEGTNGHRIQMLPTSVKVDGANGTYRPMRAPSISASSQVTPWMEACGVRFQPSLTGTLNLSRTNAFFLGGGKALLNAYFATAERIGVDVLYDTEVRALDGVNVEFERPLSEAQARACLKKAPGVTVVDHRADEGYVTPAEAAGEDSVFVSRIRRDPTVPNGLNLWVVADNLRKGAALNAVQIAEVLARDYLKSAAKAPARAL